MTSDVRSNSRPEYLRTMQYDDDTALDLILREPGRTPLHRASTSRSAHLGTSCRSGTWARRAGGSSSPRDARPRGFGLADSRPRLAGTARTGTTARLETSLGTRCRKSTQCPYQDRTVLPSSLLKACAPQARGPANPHRMVCIHLRTVIRTAKEMLEGKSQSCQTA